MRLRSLLGLSYAAVATALTNVGFGGKRGSYKHFQGLDLEFYGSAVLIGLPHKQTLFDGAPTRRPPPIWQTTTRARVFGLPGGVGA